MNNADQTQENIELKQRLAALELQLSEQNVTLKKQDSALKKQDSALENKDHKIQTLEEYIRYMVQQRFGSSSEKLSADQINLFDEAELCWESELAEWAELLDTDVS